MIRPLRVAGALAAGVLLATIGAGAGDSPPRPPRPGRGRPPGPFYVLREQPTDYFGPGRELPAPRHARSVDIAFFGPPDGNDPAAGDLWRAAVLAVEEANRAGGCRGLPVRLVPCWADGPWGTGVAQLARAAWREDIWAVIGGPDGATAHLAEQVVAKARLTLLSPVATDKTVNLAHVPWTFSLAPGDHVLAAALARQVAAGSPRRTVAMLSAADHDSRAFAGELAKALAAAGCRLTRRIVYRPAQVRPARPAAEALAARPDAVVVVAPPSAAAEMVAAVRRIDRQVPLFGGPRMGRRAFAGRAGAAAEGVVFPVLYAPEPNDPGGPARRFARRWNVPCDYAAAHTYDAVRLILAAIERAGLNRARIRDAVAELAPWPGCTGTVRWDRLGSNTRLAGLGTVRRGRVVPLTSRSLP